MSTFAVKVERIRKVEPHPNADRLDLVQINDWWCVVQKGSFKENDLCVYFPVDSILSRQVEEAIFGPDSKVKLTKSRVRTIKLRGAISQGLAVGIEVLRGVRGNWGDGYQEFYEHDDLTAILGIVKYEPPSNEIPMAMRGSQTSKTNPYFKKYTDLDNAKFHPGVFEPAEAVIITEKIHGTNFRAGYVPAVANTFWKKVLQFFHLLPKYEFVYGSRNVQLQDRRDGGSTWIQKHTDVTENVYLEAVVKYRLRELLKPGEVLYGEVYGAGIQKDYTYGCEADERKFVAFDMAVLDEEGNTKYLSSLHFMSVCKSRGIPTVPVLFTGGFDFEFVRSLTKGASVLAPSQKVREGVVIKPLVEKTHPLIGRKALKMINDDYLLNRDNTDFH